MEPSNHIIHSPHWSQPQRVYRVSGCSEISKGDYIEARIAETLFFSGRIDDIQPAMDLFWVITEQGARQIVEFSEFDVYLRT
ncbi:hypothetical protein [Pseudarthrobacter sp. fls2-241-R2A-127]|uniref:hypothetical protein n=1 Tax=Pseudarthrobacter sp. fls2-241-R2A-127 TaxID=3040303 RepID=UPI0025558512|nr:hypothetical protein [Pseudarthrobacter sp. fls2-241-R2A-127]